MHTHTTTELVCLEGAIAAIHTAPDTPLQAAIRRAVAAADHVGWSLWNDTEEAVDIAEDEAFEARAAMVSAFMALGVTPAMLRRIRDVL